MASNSIFIGAAVATGALIPLQVAFNAQLGRVTGHPLIASVIVFIVGLAALLCAVALLRPVLPEATSLRNAPATAWLGGLIAATYIISIVIIAPKLGVGRTTIMILAGQILTALALDHFAVFSQHVPINPWRAAGGLLVIGGAILIRTH